MVWARWNELNETWIIQNLCSKKREKTFFTSNIDSYLFIYLIKMKPGVISLDSGVALPPLIDKQKVIKREEKVVVFIPSWRREPKSSLRQLAKFSLIKNFIWSWKKKKLLFDSFPCYFLFSSFLLSLWSSQV